MTNTNTTPATIDNAQEVETLFDRLDGLISNLKATKKDKGEEQAVAQFKGDAVAMIPQFPVDELESAKFKTLSDRSNLLSFIFLMRYFPETKGDVGRFGEFVRKQWLATDANKGANERYNDFTDGMCERFPNSPEFQGLIQISKAATPLNANGNFNYMDFTKTVKESINKNEAIFAEILTNPQVAPVDEEGFENGGDLLVPEPTQPELIITLEDCKRKTTEDYQTKLSQPCQNFENSLYGKVKTKIEAGKLTSHEDVIAEWDNAIASSSKHKAAKEAIDEANKAEIAKAEAKAKAVSNQKAAIELLEKQVDKNDCLTLVKGLSVDQFITFSDYTSNRDAKKRAESAKAPSASSRNGKHPHLVGNLTALQQTIVKLFYITKENAPQTWESVEKYCEANGLPCSLPYVIGDAHSRKYAWMIEDLNDGVDGWKLERPEQVQTLVFTKNVKGEPLTDADFYAMVEAECSKFTAFTNEEQNQVAKIESGLQGEIKSAFVDKQWMSAVAIYHPAADLKSIRAKFRDELIKLDAIAIKFGKLARGDDRSRLVTSGIKAGILKSFDIAKEKGVSVDTLLNKFWGEFFTTLIDANSVIKNSIINELDSWIYADQQGQKRYHPEIETKEIVSVQGGSYDAALCCKVVQVVNKWIDARKAELEAVQPTTAQEVAEQE